MIDVEGLWFRYAASTRDALADVNLHLPQGQFTLIAGQSGSGKSTFLRCLNGLIPHFHGGHFAGQVVVAGHNTRAYAPRDVATVVGTVFQDPESQLITDTPEEELTFALENLGYSSTAIAQRIEATCDLLAIDHLRTRSITTLSGGERQLTALAAAIAPGPQAVVLDEPTSQLDPHNSKQVLDALTGLQATAGLAVMLSEHRLSNLLTLADSVLHINEGRAHAHAPEHVVAPLTRDGLLRPRLECSPGQNASSPVDVILAAEGVSFAYHDRRVLDGLDLTLHEGELVALIGANGSGKTTLLKHLIGLLRPDAGRITIKGRDITEDPIQSIARTVGYVPQHPTIMLHQETVADELRFTLEGLGRDGDIQRTLAAVDLAGFEPRHPLDLSGGERQRLAIAAIAVAGPRVLLLDEPTRGLSWSAKASLARTLKTFAAAGSAILVATHDRDFVEAFADRHLALEYGCVATDAQAKSPLRAADSQIRDPDPVLTISNPG